MQPPSTLRVRALRSATVGCTPNAPALRHRAPLALPRRAFAPAGSRGPRAAAIRDLAARRALRFSPARHWPPPASGPEGPRAAAVLPRTDGKGPLCPKSPRATNPRPRRRRVRVNPFSQRRTQAKRLAGCAPLRYRRLYPRARRGVGRHPKNSFARDQEELRSTSSRGREFGTVRPISRTR